MSIHRHNCRYPVLHGETILIFFLSDDTMELPPDDTSLASPDDKSKAVFI
jgi:hypothetical protein